MLRTDQALDPVQALLPQGDPDGADQDEVLPEELFHAQRVQSAERAIGPGLHPSSVQGNNMALD